MWKHDSGMGTDQSLDVISGKIRRGGYKIFWIFLIRRPSKYELTNQWQPLHKYMKAVLPNERYIIWDSSLMFLDPDNYLMEMGQFLNLDFSEAEEIYNADEKWLKEYVAT